MEHNEREELIDLGSASFETKGGPIGIDDNRTTLILTETGLSPD